MKTFLATLTAFTLALSLGIAAPAAADQKLKEILDQPTDLAFTGSFAKFLVEVPTADFTDFRTQLKKAIENKELPRRHAGKTMKMTDKRWVEIDRPGFLNACKDKDAEVARSAKLHACILLIESDPQTAIQTYRELALDQETGDIHELFFSPHAAKDPKLAWQIFHELGIQKKFQDGTATIIRIWAKQDTNAAWSAVETLTPKVGPTNTFPPDSSDTSNLRGLVCAAAAHTDEALASRLLDSVEPPNSPASVRNFFITELALTKLELALTWTLQFNTPETMRTFCGRVRWGTDEETLRKLLELVPKDHLRNYLIAFFTEDVYMLLPDFRHARLIPQIPDQELRRAVIINIIGEIHTRYIRNNTSSPLLVALTDAVVAEGPDLLAASMPPSHRISLLRLVMVKNPDLALPWILALNESDWLESRHDLARFWPISALSAWVPQLLAAITPRESALAELLAERWWLNEPIAAFPHIKEKYPKLIQYRFNPESFLKGCGNDLKKARELLATVPDPAARAAAQGQFVISSAQDGSPVEVLTLVLDQLKKPDIRDAEKVCGLAVQHKSPEMDKLIAAIPDDRESDRDRLLGLRAARLFKQGEDARAYALWRQIRKDEALLSSLASGARSGMDPTKIKDWETLVAIASIRPASTRRTYVLKDFAETMARYAPMPGIAIAGSTQDAETRMLILTSTAKDLENPKKLEAGLALVRTLPENDDTKPIHAAWRQAAARIDPAQGWKLAVERGLDTDEGRHLGLIAIERLAKNDAKAALTLLIDASPAGLRHEFLIPVARGLTATDPAAAVRTALAMPPQVRSSLLNQTFTAWVKIDPAAACAASLEIQTSSSDDRYFFPNCLSEWLRTHEAQALDWIGALQNPDSRIKGFQIAIPAIASKNSAKATQLFSENPSVRKLAQVPIAIAQSLATSNYSAACRFLAGAGTEADPAPIATAMERLILPWFDADPTAAADFLKSLPSSPMANLLNPKLHDKLLPRYRAVLDGWNPQPTPTTPSDNLTENADRDSNPDFAAVRASIEAMPDDAAKIRAIQQFIQSWIPNPRRHADIHAILKTLPENDSLRIHADMLAKNGIGIPGFEDAFLYPEPASSPIPAILDRLNAALLKNDLPSALQAAAELPAPRFEHLTIRVLTAFPTQADAQAAAETIPNPESRERTKARLKLK